MKRFAIAPALVAGLALAAPAVAESPQQNTPQNAEQTMQGERTKVEGKVKVEKSDAGSIENVTVVAESGEVTHVIGTAREAIARHDGETVEVQGRLAMRSDGQRTLVAEGYSVQ